MADFFWFSDRQWARIEPLLPTNMRGMKRVDDCRVLSGIVHALKCGGRWADCADVYGPKKHSTTGLSAGLSAAYGKTSLVRWRARKVHRTGCSSTVPVSRFTAAPVAQKGGPGSWYRPHERRTQHQTPCRHPPNWSQIKATTARLCANGWKPVEPKLLSLRAATVKSSTNTIESSTNSETSSSACSAASRTGGALPHVLTAISKPL